jgi:hypothetical protein
MGMQACLHGIAWACMGMPRHANQYAWVCLSAMGMACLGKANLPTQLPYLDFYFVNKKCLNLKKLVKFHIL